ncbi:hypothetical protein EZV62_012995 [Acer yangbiense]|uniref:RING-type domain-containing protein n=1 Tax=Acer yangbiense TaxID=1000413 RepID=A0A5C7HZS1_9ROSI|nr:hypothetical protein EZV62_012995 [Acer yangbiense]
MANDYVKVRKRLLLDCLTCPLCKNPYKEATTICVCLHTSLNANVPQSLRKILVFCLAVCKECICENLEEGKNNCCPVCDAYLGSFPEQLLR